MKTYEVVMGLVCATLPVWLFPFLHLVAMIRDWI